MQYGESIGIWKTKNKIGRSSDKSFSEKVKSQVG